MEKINRLTRREFREDEVYTFPVTLCDNEIDRDGERFSDAALEAMAELFVGKTGIFDHDPSAANQTARIYDTEIVTDDARLTSYGAPYKCLKGYAYMVRTSANADLITLIDGGIRKEVSVSCSAGRRLCSVCGADLTQHACTHRKGETYNGALCHTILDGITDAYEWSFVAVPAQVGAGVTKSHHINEKGGISMEEFTPITTRADFEAAAQVLVDAAVSAKAAEFEGYISPEAHRQALDEQEAAHKAALLGAYREKAALAAGIPSELADRINGETEEEITKDAQKLAAFAGKGHATPKFAAETPTAHSTQDAALCEMLENLKN